MERWRDDRWAGALAVIGIVALVIGLLLYNFTWNWRSEATYLFGIAISSIVGTLTLPLLSISPCLRSFFSTGLYIGSASFVTGMLNFTSTQNTNFLAKIGGTSQVLAIIAAAFLILSGACAFFRW